MKTLKRCLFLAIAVLFFTVSFNLVATGAPIEISYTDVGGSATVKDGNVVQKTLEDKFGVKIKNIRVGGGEGIDLLFATGELPDCITIGGAKDAFEVFSQGLLRSIPKSMIRKYAPTYAQILDRTPGGWTAFQEPGNPDNLIVLPNADDGMYPGAYFLPGFRLDWLERVGMAPPKAELKLINEKIHLYLWDNAFTLDELEKILVAFKENDLAGGGMTLPMTGTFEDVRGFTFSCIEFAFGQNSADNLLVAGELVEPNISPNFKAFLKLLQKWYKMGLIDPEFPSTDFWGGWNKQSAGLVGFFPCSWAYIDSTVPAFRARPPQSIVIAHPDAKILITQPLKGPGGQKEGWWYSALSVGTEKLFIKKNVSDEKLVKILQIWDYTSSDKEGRILYMWGVPGVHFEWAGEPYKSAPVPKEGVKGQEEGIRVYGTVNYTKDMLPIVFNKETLVVADWLQTEKMVKMRILPYRYDQFKKTNLTALNMKYRADLNTMTSEFLFKAVTGKIDIDAEWDTYVKNWRAAGGNEILAEYQKAPLTADILSGKATP